MPLVAARWRAGCQRPDLIGWAKATEVGQIAALRGGMLTAEFILPAGVAHSDRIGCRAKSGQIPGGVRSVVEVDVGGDRLNGPPEGLAEKGDLLEDPQLGEIARSASSDSR